VPAAAGSHRSSSFSKATQITLFSGDLPVILLIPAERPEQVVTGFSLALIYSE